MNIVTRKETKQNGIYAFADVARSWQNVASVVMFLESFCSSYPYVIGKEQSSCVIQGGLVVFLL